MHTRPSTATLGGLVTLFLLFGAPAAFAAEIPVLCSQGADLQAAIGSAADNDTLVIEGECVGNFVIDAATVDVGVSSLTLISMGEERAVLDARGAATDGNGTVLTVGPTMTVELRNVTVTGGTDGYRHTGGIYSEGTLRLVDCLVTENHLHRGIFRSVGGIHQEGVRALSGYGRLTGLELVRTEVSHNTARQSNGPDLTDNFGGLLSLNATLTLRESHVDENVAIADGHTYSLASTAGISFQFFPWTPDPVPPLDHYLLIEGSTINGNYARAEGEVGPYTSWVGANAGLITIIFSNYPTSDGPVRVRDSEISGNTGRTLATNPDGYFGGPASCTAAISLIQPWFLADIQNTRIADNSCTVETDSGPHFQSRAAVIDGGPILLVDSTVEDNRATAFGGTSTGSTIAIAGVHAPDFIGLLGSEVRGNVARTQTTNRTGQESAIGGISSQGYLYTWNGSVSENGAFGEGGRTGGVHDHSEVPGSGVDIDGTWVTDNVPDNCNFEAPECSSSTQNSRVQGRR